MFAKIIAGQIISFLLVLVVNLGSLGITAAWMESWGKTMFFSVLFAVVIGAGCTAFLESEPKKEDNKDANS